MRMRTNRNLSWWRTRRWSRWSLFRDKEERDLGNWKRPFFKVILFNVCMKMRTKWNFNLVFAVIFDGKVFDFHSFMLVRKNFYSFEKRQFRADTRMKWDGFWVSLMTSKCNHVSRIILRSQNLNTNKSYSISVLWFSNWAYLYDSSQHMKIYESH